MKANRIFLALAFVPITASAQFVPTNSLTLWYDRPAVKWEQALPVGNGRLGAMIFGGTTNERVQLNDITVWSGGSQSDADRADAYNSRSPEVPRDCAAVPVCQDLRSENSFSVFQWTQLLFSKSNCWLGDTTM